MFELIKQACFVFIVCYLSGCGFSKVFKQPSDAEFNNYADWLENQEGLFKQYFGKTREEIKGIFGEPAEIFYRAEGSVSPYEETWRYRYLPIGEGEKYDFRFKEGVLDYVEVFGRKAKNR